MSSVNFLLVVGKYSSIFLRLGIKTFFVEDCFNRSFALTVLTERTYLLIFAVVFVSLENFHIT